MKFKSKYNFNDYKNKTINYLTAIEPVEELSKDSSKQWKFKCICGVTIIDTPYRVISGHRKSCGCMRYKNISHKPHEVKTMRIEPSDYIGKKNYNLTVVDVEKSTGRTKLICSCTCGNTTTCLPYQFNKGIVKSCGCMKGKHEGNTTPTKHGYSHHPLYKTWRGMIQRCYNPNHVKYNLYGGRGITVCEEWRESPALFIEWASANCENLANLTLDRIDNNKGYSPTNCKWSTITEQNRNRRTNTMITINGKTECLSYWMETYGIDYNQYRVLKRQGISNEEIFSSKT